MRKIVVALLLVFCMLSFGQGTISGVVFDDQNHPVYNASVYINGTTIGMSTDSSGAFVFEKVVFPCQVVVAHINYKLAVMSLNESSDVVFKLKSESWEIKEVEVDASSNREENVNDFKAVFLGGDYWGQKSNLLNDSDLYFVKQVDTIYCVANEGSENEKSSYHLKSTMTVHSRKPLIVELPLLGYTVSIDLVDCIYTKTIFQFEYESYLGFYKFTPYQSKSRLKNKRYSKNREKVYYNSTLHFMRCLYDDALNTNGYLLLEKIQDKTKNTSMFLTTEVKIQKDVKDENMAYVIGQKDKDYMLYFEAYNGKPKDWTKQDDINLSCFNPYTKEGANEVKRLSSITFGSDTCEFYSDGIIPNNKILFGGFISKKKVGTALPSDYYPESK